MIVPRYWAKETSAERSPRGKTVPFAVWRWSESSLEEARTRAREAAGRIALRIRSGDPLPERYAYGDRPVREAVIREHRGPDGSVSLAVTRNVYGALILNSASVMFIDIDLDMPGRAQRMGAWLKRMFRGGATSRAREPVDVALDRLREWVASRSHWAVRVYRTRAGLRYLVTHQTLQPGASEVEEAMDYFGADPRYRALCRVQQSFRARLTPKPWRCGLKLPPVRFPYENEDQERAMAAWQTRYAAACKAWATCAFVESVGNGDLHPDIEPVRRLHDEMTRIDAALPLA